MFEASVDGQLYDPERFGQYYRPYGIDAPSSSGAPKATTPAPAAPAPAPTVAPDPAPAPVAEAAPAPAPAAAPAEGGEKPSAQDILQMIRARKED